MAQHSGNYIEDVYRGVINDVINHVKEAFLDENVDVEVLLQLKQLWEAKVRESGAVDLDGPRHPPPRALPAQRAVNVTRPVPPSSATLPVAAAAHISSSSTSVIQTAAASSLSQPKMGGGDGPTDYPQPIHHSLNHNHHHVTAQSQPPQITAAHQQLLHEAANLLVDQQQQRFQVVQQQQHQQHQPQLHQALTAGQLSQLVGVGGLADFQQQQQHNSALSLPPGVVVLSGSGGARYIVQNDAGLKDATIKKEVAVGSAYRPTATATMVRGPGGVSQVLMLNPQAQPQQQLHHVSGSHSQPIGTVAGLTQVQLQQQQSQQAAAIQHIVNMQQQQHLKARPSQTMPNFPLGGSSYVTGSSVDGQPVAAKKEDYRSSSSSSRIPQLDGGGPGMSDSSTSEEEDEEELQRFQNLGNDKLEDEEAGDEDPLNSDDDQSDDEDLETLFEADNVVVCQFEKIHRARNKWKFTLKDGVMRIDGKEYCFQKCSGDAEW